MTIIHDVVSWNITEVIVFHLVVKQILHFLFLLSVVSPFLSSSLFLCLSFQLFRQFFVRKLFVSLPLSSFSLPSLFPLSHCLPLPPPLIWPLFFSLLSSNPSLSPSSLVPFFVVLSHSLCCFLFPLAFYQLFRIFTKSSAADKTNHKRLQTTILSREEY